ncbi:lipoprotein N-acyltransferase Lnb domain-containing protein [Psychrobacter sp.]|uniref:lipoprotein N-acyltransferase Lnb domain-containing protein n=1 Tax=unclassified Psychrobacter TaxID=196806 RepID=UPI003F9A5D6B
MQKIFLWVACFSASTAYAVGVDELSVIDSNDYEPKPAKLESVGKKEQAVAINDHVIETDIVDSRANSEMDALPDVENNIEQIIELTNKVQSQEPKQDANKSITIDPLKLQALSKHRQWQHLLFYKDGKAEVISLGFYLTNPKPRSKRDVDPYAELIATIESIDDEKVVCKYPARYLWLTHHLPELHVNLNECVQLPDPNQEISLILVSNYLKNPASSFGHVLVKTSLPTGDKDNNTISTNAKNDNAKDDNANEVRELSSEDLLNSSYNFGASIPANENGAMYAIKGLFGLYDAGFSETEFFKQDAVYSKNEQRDMWEYVLNLESYETQLLNYHLYEAKSARFDYYFIKQNCGYRSGEILELISDVKTTERIGPWYAPDYVFDQLLEHEDGTESLVSSVRYLPSEQTQLREKFGQLPKPIQDIINSVIRTENIELLATLNTEDKALALDFLILHRTYKISQNDTPKHQSFKSELLSQRFKLPASNGLAQLPVPNKASPALSNKTTQTKVVLSDEMAEIGLSLFVKDPLNAYTDIDKRFEAVQASLGYDFDKHQLTLTDFVFLDMQQIEDLRQPLSGEPKLSWQLKTGARTDWFTGNHHSPYAQAGVGAGAKFGEHVLGYGMVNATVHDQDKHADIGIEVGVRAKRDRQSAELSYIASKREGRTSMNLTKLTLRQQLSKNDDARIVVTYSDTVTADNNAILDDIDKLNAAIAWHHYW